jgi:hypothetical protein
MVFDTLKGPTASLQGKKPGNASGDFTDLQKKFPDGNIPIDLADSIQYMQNIPKSVLATKRSKRF